TFVDGLVVQPFETASTDDRQVAQNIEDELFVDLSKTGAVKVLARDVRNARTVLRGRLDHIDKVVRLHVELISGPDGRQIWAETFERNLDDAQALQRDLALRILAVLKIKLSPNDSSTQTPTKNEEAYLLYVRATELAKRLEKKRAELDEAEQLYGRAIQL